MAISINFYSFFSSFLERNTSVGEHFLALRIRSNQKAAERTVHWCSWRYLRIHLKLRGERSIGRRLHHLLRESNRLCVVHVWTHVYVLWLRDEALAWRNQRRCLSTVPCAHPRCDSHVQIVNETQQAGDVEQTNETLISSQKRKCRNNNGAPCPRL